VVRAEKCLKPPEKRIVTQGGCASDHGGAAATAASMFDVIALA